MEQKKTFHFQNVLKELHGKQSDSISETDSNCSDIIRCRFSDEDFLSCKSETVSRALLDEDHRCRTCSQPIDRHQRDPLAAEQMKMIERCIKCIFQSSGENSLDPLYFHLGYAINKGQFDVVSHIESKYPIDHEIWNRCVIDAARYGYFDVVKYAELHGANRVSLLHAGAYAAKNGYLEILKYIVSKGYVDWMYYQGHATDGKQKEIVEYCKSEEANQLCHTLDL